MESSHDAQTNLVVLEPDLETAQDGPLFERRANLRGKDESILLPRFPGKLSELLHILNFGREKIADKPREVDCPLAPVRFGRTEPEAN